MRPPILRDPLAIDVDGDGAETVGITANPVLFDHNADGIKTGTGWVNGDDAWLVLDRDGNGTIDTGRELFGVDTLVSGTPGQDAAYASSGFEALRTLDVNHDNVFNASDAAFTQVRLWQDINQDGISQSNELFTLAQKNIASIGLNVSAVTTELGNGNVVSGTSVVTRINGTTTLAGTVGVAADTTAVNLNLPNNPFYRAFTNPVTLSATAQALPEVHGRGWVRDLREAMSLGTSQSDELAGKVQAFVGTTTREGQMALVDDILRLWSLTNQAQVLRERSFALVGNAEVTTKLQAAMPILQVFDGINVDDAGMQAPIQSVYRLGADQSAVLLNSYESLRQSVYGALVLQTRLKPYMDSIQLDVSTTGVQFNTSALAAMLTSMKSSHIANAFDDLVDLNRYAYDTLNGAGFESFEMLRSWVADVPGGSSLEAYLKTLRVYKSSDQAASSLSDIYIFGGGNDTVNAGAGNDMLHGGVGDDNLMGGAGDDVMDGGAGNDTLSGSYHNTFHGWYGGAGNDTYLFGRGDGQDTVYDRDGEAGNFDKLIFKTGIAPSDVLLSRQGDSLVLKIAGTTDQVTLMGYLQSDGASAWAIEQVRFADGTAWDVATIKAKLLVGGDADDAIVGYASADVITGGLGNDDLRGADGDDFVDGEAGNDYLLGNAGNDTLRGGAGDDRLMGGSGDDIMEGGAGNDILSGNYHYIVNGWYDGAGNDSYLFGRGDGQDIIYDPDGMVGNIDKLIFKAGIAPSDVLLSRQGDSLLLKIAGTTDQVTLSNYLLSDGDSAWRIEQIVFADGTAWDVSTVKAKLLAGGEGNDTIVGYASNDTISGGAGNDDLQGAGGDDHLDGGVGDDLVSGNAGNDTLLGGAGNDKIQGGVGDDIMDGGAGNDTLSGDYHNTFQGWYSGAGNDTYLFGRGDGQDTIYDIDGTVGNIDKLVFKAGVAPGDILLSRQGDFLVLKISGTTDQVAIYGYFANDGATAWSMERIEFNDGTAWNLETVKALIFTGGPSNDTIVGYASNDTISGGAGNDDLQGAGGDDHLDGGVGDDLVSGNAGNDTLLGGAGNDKIQGGVGDDIMDGGAGNDTLSGDYHNTFQGWYSGAGNDTYLFGRGDGQDTIYDIDGMVGNIDKLVFKAGVAPGDILLSRQGDFLVLKISGTTDQVAIYGYFANDGATAWSIERIEFNDGTVWDVSTVKAKLLVGGEGNDAIVGYASNDTISGGAGNDNLQGAGGDDLVDGGTGDDYVYGNAGNDTLLGGAGNDQLQGGVGDDTMDGGAGNDTLSGDYHNTFQGWYSGAGSDTYLFGRSDGQDIIYDLDGATGNLDRLVFKAGVAVSDVLISRTGDNLVLKINGTTDQVTVANHFANDASSGWLLEEIRFTDDSATVWTASNIKNMALIGGASNDTLTGYAGNDVLMGNDGNDTINARAGNDTVYGGNGGDSLNGEDGDDRLLGEAGGDTLSGGNGDDTIYGGSDGDNLQGGNGNDLLDGGEGNDILAGGIYTPWTNNGAGNDTYLFGRGSGQDRIYDVDSTAGNTDVISVGIDIAVDQLWFRRVGSDLEVSIIGSTDKSTISNWYSGTAYHVEQFKTSDGRMLLDSQVDALVSAMAAFAPPAAGQTTLPANYQSALSPVIAANWT